MKRGTTWFAWAFHFFLGLLVGVLLGFAVITSRRRFLLLAVEQVPAFITGAALLGAGICSFYGDRLWLGSYRFIASDLEHSATTRFLSLGTGSLGGLLMLTALLRHWEVF